MNNEKLIKEINKQLENARTVDGNISRDINMLISNLESEYRDRIFSLLTNIAIVNLYSILDKVNIDNHLKEHILWKYHKIQFKENGVEKVGECLDSLIDDYNKYSFDALESLVIDLLPNFDFTREHILTIEKNFKSPELKKQVASIRAVNDIRKNIRFGKNRVEMLIELAAYSVLELGLENGLIEEDALDCFVMPAQGEKNRKIKLELYNNAQKTKEKRGLI